MFDCCKAQASWSNGVALDCCGLSFPFSLELAKIVYSKLWLIDCGI